MVKKVKVQKNKAHYMKQKYTEAFYGYYVVCDDLVISNFLRIDEAIYEGRGCFLHKAFATF